MQDSLEYGYLFKYILVGDSSVGKSSLLSSYISNQFNGNSNPTMGVQFATKKLNLNGTIIKLQIWDTAGQESFRTITRAYYKNAIGVILVYDQSNPKSIESLQSWLAEIQQNSSQIVQIVLVGNKVDLISRQVALPSSMAIFQKYSTSAKSGLNVNKLFQQLSTNILSKVLRAQIPTDGSNGVKKGTIKRGKIEKSTKLKSTQNDYQLDNKSSKCC